MKTLHVFSYEKFAPHVIDIVESVNPGRNRYIINGSTGDRPYDARTSVACRTYSGPFRLDPPTREDLKWCDVVFFHSLFAQHADAISQLKKNTTLVWCAMGADIYRHSSHFKGKTLLPATRLAERQLARRWPKSRSEKIKRFLHALRTSRFLNPSGQDRNQFKIQCIAARIDIICSIERDLQLERNLPGFRAKQLDYFDYYTLERALSAGAKPINGRDILVGNSASWSNNHLDIFEQFRDLDLGSRRIVLPLSYGRFEIANLVLERAVELFGADRVFALRDWMSIENYNRTLESCGVVVMNHVRGQALGNICSMLFRGSTVLLRRENPYFQYLQHLGVHLRTVPAGPISEEDIEALTPEQRIANTEAMRAHWTRSAVESRAQARFKEIWELRKALDG